MMSLNFMHMLLRIVIKVPLRTDAGLVDVHRSSDVPHDVAQF